MARWLIKVLTRDALSFMGGWFIILYQMLAVPPEKVNEWFLLLGGSLINVPGIAQLFTVRAGYTPESPSESRERVPL